MAPIATPIAPERQERKLLKLTKKCKEISLKSIDSNTSSAIVIKQKNIKRGVKEVVKALDKIKPSKKDQWYIYVACLH